MSIIKRFKQSFSLIEVLIFVAILSMFFVLAIAIVTASIRSMQLSTHKLLATRYAQELVHWLQTEKEADWNIFATTRASPGGKTYCFNHQLPTNWDATIESTACTSDTALLMFQGIEGIDPQIYNREVSLKSYSNPPSSPPYRVDASVVVSWKELGVGQTVPILTSFFTWE